MDPWCTSGRSHSHNEIDLRIDLLHRHSDLCTVSRMANTRCNSLQEDSLRLCRKTWRTKSYLSWRRRSANQSALTFFCLQCSASTWSDLVTWNEILPTNYIWNWNPLDLQKIGFLQINWPLVFIEINRNVIRRYIGYCVYWTLSSVIWR